MGLQVRLCRIHLILFFACSVLLWCSYDYLCVFVTRVLTDADTHPCFGCAFTCSRMTVY
ncbi:hypothetical protein PISMIDRAFT_672723 [Pisolithus microcarpus 441]|uniref:Uncharacterized protein n=1 Tax=Pisolithus microcarpus 441 TaxID=765257 RepID=A0A0C9YW03_9AGAM|nr:hypothetical protein PISMIDRAFT_672723 [Pisolithus microcarpus 441]